MPSHDMVYNIMHHMQNWKEVRRGKIKGQTGAYLGKSLDGDDRTGACREDGSSVEAGCAAGREAAEGRAEASDCDVGAG